MVPDPLVSVAVIVEVKVTIEGSKEAIWAAASDIENAATTVKGIDKIEILEQPASADSLVGLKWRETRTMFGKDATEVMWITESVPNEFYKTRAESHGSIYTGTVAIKPLDGGSCSLSTTLDAKPQSFFAKMSLGTDGVAVQRRDEEGAAGRFSTTSRQLWRKRLRDELSRGRGERTTAPSPTSRMRSPFSHPTTSAASEAREGGFNSHLTIRTRRSGFPSCDRITSPRRGNRRTSAPGRGRRGSRRGRGHAAVRARGRRRIRGLLGRTT